MSIISFRSKQKTKRGLLYSNIKEYLQLYDKVSFTIPDWEPDEYTADLADIEWLEARISCDITAFSAVNEKTGQEMILWIIVGNNPMSSWACHINNIEELLKESETRELLLSPEKIIQFTEQYRKLLEDQHKITIYSPDYSRLLNMVP